MPVLQDDFEHQHIEVRELFIDRAYIASDFVEHVIANQGEVICRPWQFSNRGLFAKADFDINIRNRTITCPQGQMQRIEFGTTVSFDGRRVAGVHCVRSAPRPSTAVAKSASRPTKLSNNAFVISSPHPAVANAYASACPSSIDSAHISSRQGPRARYRGVRKNTFDCVASPRSRTLRTHNASASKCPQRGSASPPKPFGCDLGACSSLDLTVDSSVDWSRWAASPLVRRRVRVTVAPARATASGRCA